MVLWDEGGLLQTLVRESGVRGWIIWMSKRKEYSAKGIKVWPAIQHHHHARESSASQWVTQMKWSHFVWGNFLKLAHFVDMDLWNRYIMEQGCMRFPLHSSRWCHRQGGIFLPVGILEMGYGCCCHSLSVLDCRSISQLLGRQWRCTAVQSGSFLWGGIGHKGYRASGCSCCLRWEYRRGLCVCVAAADAWNGTQVAGRASGLRCIFRQVITLLHWFFSLLHWSEKITGKRERKRKREWDAGRGGGHWLT